MPSQLPPKDTVIACESVAEFCPPVSAQECTRLMGLRSGKQGDINSVGMDSRLIATFVCTDRFDFLLHLEIEDTEPSLSTTTETKCTREKISGLIARLNIQKLFRENIIYPLRRSHYFPIYFYVSLFLYIVYCTSIISGKLTN